MWESNLLTYVGSCYGAMFENFQWPFPGYNDGFKNNTCVFRTSYNSDCNIHSSFAANLGANSVYSADGSLSVCNMSFSDWQKAGHDTKTTLGKWPDDAQLVKQAKKMLGF